MRLTRLDLWLPIALTGLLGATSASACPFCTAEARTLTEELADVDVAALGSLAKEVSPAESQRSGGTPSNAVDPETALARFKINRVLLGQERLGSVEEIKAIFFGEEEAQNHYLLRGIGEPLDWLIPLELSPIAVDYVPQLLTLPESGADRLAFFQDYLQHDDPLLAQDAYDEFARAPYDDLIGLKDRMNRKNILAWIESRSVSPSRRRLFLTMLGVCGQPEDLPRLEAMLQSDSRVLVRAVDAMTSASVLIGGPLAGRLSVEEARLEERRRKMGLDALVACYLTLRGSEGLDLIDRRFLTGEGIDYSHIYSVLMAIRFLAEETTTIPRERILQSARLLLDNSDFADQVIPDLARWDDWSILDRLVNMYHESGNGTVQKYVREPIITYLDVAAEQGGELAQRANAALKELEPIDPEAFRRARSLRAFGFLAQARGATENFATETDASDTASGIDAGAIPNPADFDPRDEDLALEEDDPTYQTAIPEAQGLGNPNTHQSDDPSSDDNALLASQGPDLSEQETAPPSRWLLVMAPLFAGGICFGVFLLILRGGAA